MNLLHNFTNMDVLHNLNNEDSIVPFEYKVESDIIEDIILDFDDGQVKAMLLNGYTTSGIFKLQSMLLELKFPNNIEGRESLFEGIDKLKQAVACKLAIIEYIKKDPKESVEHGGLTKAQDFLRTLQGQYDISLDKLNSLYADSVTKYVDGTMKIEHAKHALDFLNIPRIKKEIKHWNKMRKRVGNLALTA